jgi:hypothetical protein
MCRTLLPELGTVDGVADVGFALAAWFVDPAGNSISLLQLKESTGARAAATVPPAPLNPRR